MSGHTREALPPLPEPGINIEAGPWVAIVDGAYFTAEQMQAYARAALATQPAQPSVELSVRAVEELLQLGYTVKDDLLYPPVVRLKKEQITKELLDGGTDGAPMRAFLEAEGKSTTPAQPSTQGNEATK